MLNNAPEPAVNRSADLKKKTIVSRSMEPNEDAIKSWNQLKNILRKHESERNPDSKGKKYSE